MPLGADIVFNFCRLIELFSYVYACVLQQDKPKLIQFYVLVALP
jgi:hypothetical protein